VHGWIASPPRGIRVREKPPLLRERDPLVRVCLDHRLTGTALHPWLHTTASVAFALLMLLAISALAAWTLRALEDPWLRAAKKDQGDK
jgi:hypothetical protein